MGGAEDDEPVSKRMKLSSEQFKGVSNGSTALIPVSASSSNLMARPLQSDGDEDVVGSKGLIKRVEFVRIISKALHSLGYEKSGACLEQESGIPLQSSVVNLFTQQILNGDWDGSVATLNNVSQLDETVVKSAVFLILEQKFFEFLNGDRVMDALKMLRAEIVPLGINYSKVRELSSCIVAPSLTEVVGSPSQHTAQAKSRSNLLEELQELLPPTFMIPDKRLEHLVEQALSLQQDACRFHNSLEKEMSLYTDHQCGKDQLPCQTLQVLTEHSDEVWFLQFSHNGKYLASSSNDRSVIIWELEATGGISMKHRLRGHQKPVSYVAWSPDDHQLLTCGVEEAIRRWDISSGDCLQMYEKAGLGFVSCGWYPDGKWIISGLTDRSICLCDLDGKEVESWKEQRTLMISDLEITRDGKQILSRCKENAILLLDRETKVERMIEEEEIITSFSLSSDNNFLLVNLLNQEIHLWDIHGDLKLAATYNGHKRSRFLIRSCFGGLNQGFIACGSEDSQIYIWHRSSGELLETLPGHSGSVNCVCWNPANPQMLASASDDRTIRIWGIKDLDKKLKAASCNGFHHCNGRT